MNDAMKGRTVLVTGSTDGIGKATALGLARMGSKVLLHGRDPEKGRRVREEIARTTGSDQLDLFIADLVSQRQVRKLAAESSGGMNVCTFSSTMPEPSRSSAS
jgi:NAD(P)-dependent dehydrogenase (short-subunit alcohol dehydrogenase family)